MAVAGLILAAGKGTRMKSDLPKGLHKVCGVPMVTLVARAMEKAGVSDTFFVIGHGGELVQKELGESYRYAWQLEQKGTGHAAMVALPLLEGFEGAVLISPGDTPLVTEETFRKLIDSHLSEKNMMTLATAVLEDPSGYGRIIRDDSGTPCKIVEHKDASACELSVKEVNPGFYVLDASILREVLPGLSNENSQGEYYLTDIVKAVYERKGKIQGIQFTDHSIMVGVNDRWQLAEAAKSLRVSILKKHALAGVTIVDPDSTYIEPDVEIGINATLEPGTILEGKTKIGANSHIGPNTKIKHSHVGDNCVVLMSHLNQASLQDNCRCGPFANLRPGAVLGDGVKIGNFVEVKNSTLHAKVSVSHLSYLGDGEVGEGSNIGAGTIFCNYDGYSKNKVDIGSNVFIGSNSTLVAPIKVGDGAFVAAGSVITKDVKADALALGRARQEQKDGWAVQWRMKKAAE